MEKVTDGVAKKATTDTAEVSSPERFCRICLLKRPNLTSLMKRVDGVMIPEMLYKLCGRQIEVQEGYPRTICQRCLSHLYRAYLFLIEFQQQDERLRSFYWSGSVGKRLQEYQDEGLKTVDKRLDKLIDQNRSLFAPPEKQMRDKETNTDDKSVHRKVVDVGTITDEVVAEQINLNAVKIESAEDNTVLFEHYVMEEEEVELAPEDDEEAYLTSSDANEQTTEEQLVSMKIDVLQGEEEDHDEQGDEAAYESISYRGTKHYRTKVSTPSLAQRAKLERGVTASSRKTSAVELEDDHEEDETMDEEAEEEEDEDYEDEDEDVEDEEEEELEDDEEEVEGQDEDTEQEANATVTENVNDPLRCYVCDHVGETPEMLEQHLDLHSIMLPYDCKICKVEGAPLRLVKSISSLQNHFRSHHFPYGCDVCGRRFLHRRQLATHETNHKTKRLMCDECGRSFTNRRTYQNHLNRHAAIREGLFKCELCNKSFGNRPRLERHRLVHTGERPYQCKYCTKTFSDRYRLEIHTEKHFKDMNCNCDVCGETFPGTKKLDDHRVEKHLRGQELEDFLAQKAAKPKRRPGKLKYRKCPFPDCDYEANTYGAMYVHKRSKHQPVHQCEICNKTFAFLNQLQVHIKLHTGEKPFRCEICGQNFRRAFSYREHMELHRTNETYTCPTCGKSFRHSTIEWTTFIRLS
uniref:Protein krueppel n=1 Tax=Anopheles farauti TaxID=69004 RepID=A0A182QIZ8_9DIPT